MKINKNHCYYCATPVDPNDYEDIGNTTIWVCGDAKCQKELSEDIKEYYANEAAQAKDERENGWMSF